MLNFIKKNIVKIIALFILIVFLDFWVGSIIKCEILTNQYGYEFNNVIKNYSMLEDTDYYKVIKYNEETAVVYCVRKGEYGDTAYMVRQGRTWMIKSFHTVWSSTGSADDFIWPYIR
ncbi:MAG TPA: hypothetical protein PLV03_05430 [Clostridiales bacterium]|nr:hypothetical protein [Clostridiales bacterium]